MCDGDDDDDDFFVPEEILPQGCWTRERTWASVIRNVARESRLDFRWQWESEGRRRVTLIIRLLIALFEFSGALIYDACTGKEGSRRLGLLGLTLYAILFFVNLLKFIANFVLSDLFGRCQCVLTFKKN